METALPGAEADAAVAGRRGTVFGSGRGAILGAVARAGRGGRARRPGLLVALVYLAAAFALTWRLWAGLGTASVAGDPGPADNDLMAWFMRYAETAVAHGHLPALVTTGLNAPHGFPLMWNNSVLLPAVLVSPVTGLAGPLAGLTVMITLGFAGSAAAMYWLLRRCGASVLAAGLGGAVFGFSPGLVNAGVGHYGMQFALFTPLLAEAVLAILTGRGRPLWAGVRLGLFAAAELFIGEEMLTDVAFVCLTLLVVLALSRPRLVPARLGPAALGLVTGVVVALLLGGYALWVQFHGPLTEHGTPWVIARHGNSFAAFVDPQSQLLLHTAGSAAFADSHQARSAEYVAYLGPPLLLLAAGVTLWFWRDLRARAAGVTWLVLEALSLGVTRTWLPFHYLQHLPLLGDTFPSRMAIVADGAAAAVLAFGLDLARSPRPTAERPTAEREAAKREAAEWEAAPLRRIVPVVIAVLAVLPLVPRPMASLTGAPVPAGWNTVFTRLPLPASASVLVVPLPNSEHGQAMLWQADTGRPGRLVAGWFLGPNATGEGFDAYWGPAYTSRTAQCLDALWQGPAHIDGCDAALRSALRYWHPGAVVADTSPGTPLGQFLTRVLGPPTVTDGQLLGWRGP